MGSNPENVVQKYTQVINIPNIYMNVNRIKYFLSLYYSKYFGRTFMPPYWALGFQISRYGYKDLDDMKQVLTRFQQNNIPLVFF